MLTTVILTIVAFLVGGALSYGFFKYGLKTKYDTIIKEAETEAEVIKKNKLLEVKEKFLNKKRIWKRRLPSVIRKFSKLRTS